MNCSCSCENKEAALCGSLPLVLFLLFTSFFAAPFAGQCLFQALLFTRLQIEGVALDLFNDVFGLHLALETAEGIL